MRRVICCLSLAAAITIGFCGCGGGDGGSNDSSAPPQTNTPEPTNSNTVAGKTFQFTVTGSQNFSEPVGAVYTLEFHSDQTYTFHPSPQNREGTSPENGTFTYDPDTGAVHFFRPDHQD